MAQTDSGKPNLRTALPRNTSPGLTRAEAKQGNRAGVLESAEEVTCIRGFTILFILAENFHNKSHLLVFFKILYESKEKQAKRVIIQTYKNNTCFHRLPKFISVSKSNS